MLIRALAIRGLSLACVTRENRHDLPARFPVGVDRSLQSAGCDGYFRWLRLHLETGAVGVAVPILIFEEPPLCHNRLLK